ncbi:Protein pitchfork [Varanus komodoensis]|nr:Protein pitchfork [Varanus komodoensis]
MGMTHMKSVLNMLSGQRPLAWELTDRLGNEHVPVRGEPHRGPGAYNHGERTTLLYLLAHRPESTKGYTMGARTTPRFGIPSKGANLDKLHQYRPGTYDPNKMPHRHVTWPGKFGSPDWSLVPTPVKRTFRTELLSDKEFRKHRNLVAYLSLYYDD